MLYKLTLIALLGLCLTGCATHSPESPPPRVLSPALLSPCPEHLPRSLETWGDLANDYAELAGELNECRERHRALAEAVI